MRYHLCKTTRLYSGKPYCGSSSNSIPAESDSLEEAQKMVAQFNSINPVGWNIIDSATGKKVKVK